MWESSKNNWKRWLSSDMAILIVIALVNILLHALLINQYGIHRDELATLEDALHLDWGFVAYPPLTPALARLGLEIFGQQSMGFRIFSSLFYSIAAVLTGLMAGELGGGRLAKVLAALAVVAAPLNMAQCSVLMYSAADYVLWVGLAYLVVRLVKSGNPRWWLAIGAVIGLGMLNKYTTTFWVLGLVGGVLISKRSWLRSPWLWGGVALSLLIFLPNLLWQINHQFISLDFLASIHARDVRIGRTSGFLSGQLIENHVTILNILWIMGLWSLLFTPRFKTWRILAWMFLIAFLGLFISQGRSYYLAPAYAGLIAAGCVWFEGWLATRPAAWAQGLKWGLGSLVLVNMLVMAALILPLGSVNGFFWQLSSHVSDLYTEEIGWTDLVQATASIYHALPAEEQSQTGIFAGNYGEAGAINLYGPQLNLPRALSTTNSFWLYGPGTHPPQNLIVLGLKAEYIQSYFKSCEYAGRNGNPYGVLNEESEDNPNILLCRQFTGDWAEFWNRFKNYG